MGGGGGGSGDGYGYGGGSHVNWLLVDRMRYE